MISRRTFTALLAASVALTAAPGCDDSPTAPSSVTVVAFGDSITAGVCTSGSNDYVSVLSNRNGVSINNSGRPGDTTAAAAARLDSPVPAGGGGHRDGFLWRHDPPESGPV